MHEIALHGSPPYHVAVVHGGPGAIGSVYPVASELARTQGVLEPYLMQSSLEGQLQSLHHSITQHAHVPLALVGHSFGGMLGYIFTARHPELVKKLILVESGVFAEKYAANIMKTRWSRLDEQDRHEAQCLLRKLSSSTIPDTPNAPNKNTIMTRVGELFEKADAYELDPAFVKPPAVPTTACRYEVFSKVWRQTRELRRNGELLAMGKNIQCPVIALHGDHDPHAAEGVRDPLTRVLNNFQLVLLEKCGHSPWMEKNARIPFFNALKNALSC